MIQKPSRLSYLLNLSLEKLNYITDNVDKYYYEIKSVKKNSDGTNKTVNGKIQYRILNPSKGELKNIQKKIKSKLLSQIKLPSNIYGGIKKKDNIKNALIISKF